MSVPSRRMGLRRLVECAVLIAIGTVLSLFEFSGPWALGGVEACPMHLMPLFLHRAVNRGDLERLDELHVMDCIECGSCAYGCPAGIPLVQSFRTGKKLVRDEYLEGKPLKQVCNTVDAAMDAGINLLDCFMSNPDIRSNLGTALKGKRDKMYIQGHFRSIWKNGQYGRTMDAQGQT